MAEPCNDQMIQLQLQTYSLLISSQENVELTRAVLL